MLIAILLLVNTALSIAKLIAKPSIKINLKLN